ncbi:MAG: hypothetical protein OCD02_00560 [Spirochaetaceae bacterium]
MSSVEFVKMAKQISLNKRDIDFMTLFMKENRDMELSNCKDLWTYILLNN